MIVFAENLSISEVQTFDPDNAVIGYDNIVTTSNISTDSEDPDFPVTNLANPNTSLEWRGLDSGATVITILTGRIDPIDYIGVAKHNFGTEQIVVSVEGRDSALASFSELVQETLLSDDTPVIFRFDPQSLYEIRLVLQPPGNSPDHPPIASVLYCGQLLVMERALYVGHTPLKYGRRTNVVNGRAESGDFLGRIVIGEYRESTASFSLIDPDWYRAYLDPFVAQAQENPFFFAWRPATYPFETGFAIVTNDPEPVPDDTSHLTQIEFDMRGVA